MKVGPPLNGISKRQSRSWVEEHFANPQKMVAGVDHAGVQTVAEGSGESDVVPVRAAGVGR